MLVRKTIITRVVVHLPADDQDAAAPRRGRRTCCRAAGRSAGAFFRPGASSRSGASSLPRATSCPGGGAADHSQLMITADVRFPSMGGEARIVLDGADTDPVQAFLAAFEHKLTRFHADSELSALNRSPQETVAASPLLRRAARAGLWAAERSGGLVDPTLLPQLCLAGYDRSRRAPELSLADALREAPARAPAHPDPVARWRHIIVDERAGTIRRPPGVELDSGGVGKGLAADLAALLVGGAERYAIDCGGDLRVGGPGAPDRPFDLHVRHPLTGEVAHELRISAGGVATSGLDVRLWRDDAGRPLHHLLDPSTGRSAWTGLIGATALAPSALEAEILAKTALLSGPRRAARVLARHGGLVVRDDGEVVPFGRLRPQIVVSVPAGRLR